MMGYEVVKRLRMNKETKQCYIIALTGYGTVNDQLLAINAGFDLHITKPVDYDDIQSILKTSQVL